MERRGEADHAFQDGQVVRVVQHAAHETLVDLQRGDRQALQVGERGVSGAEIVEGEPYAEVEAFVDDARNAGQILQRAGFQDLQLQVAAPDRAVAREQIAQAVDEVRLLQLSRADIDADRNVQSALAPAFLGRERRVDDPFADVHRCPVILDERKKRRRRQQALFGMPPANQRLRADDRAGAHVDLGLEEQHELPGDKRFLDVLQAFVVPAHDAVLVGLAQQLVGVDALALGIEGHAEAAGNLQNLVADGRRMAGRGKYPVDHGNAG